ncbi:hypothetical protein AUEXF2481DRAFT_8312 [Aureobasidium subglaciale EXF-2481]|uniref:Uncharacterized protein n=1 Tax=Aureobasidium subglaciale (strain EXF-2481) TaxID=1043005 RepID=A0A074YXT9_AURSE|nr:uncharacterized protein AUEXF2481DRAFT_8312 [Aureobasidium subglaciale EXF-2481]KAI5194661.1 hypothetical protein E4T38_09473 [Aureobasidium subglaciale]KAI5213867.1 hypothetical protein E4T40_09424 [Aureobasidium subglaciale]KAI5215834.1 hypothetical protein E4T41_09425 [Aureobasidium subglaciale]KAI5253920.1 hypothetical protein E4T46_09380 [Aureobasidium subglaciale]KEQ91646.1 hypothetical protein AUEXF2481DRAFT_8312 [Aureobasidium subglaciale EXF-2481]
MSPSRAPQDIQPVTPTPLSGRKMATRLTPSSSLKLNEQVSTRVIDSGHEETDEDPSPHTQPPASTPYTEPESEVQYMSDDDLIEENYRGTQGYSKLTATERRVWETDRAKLLCREGHAKHFECSIHLLGEAPCSTLQGYLPSRMAARPVVSCFFGHNKNEWNQINKSVRLFLCRKCYQRRGHKLGSHLASIQLPFCREMVERLKIWRPDCLFTIKLTKAMVEKVQRFEKVVAVEGSVRQEAAAEVDSDDPESRGANIRRANHTPVLVAIELENRFGGRNKTAEELSALFDWLESKMVDGTIEDIPAFEALLNISPENEEQLHTQQKRRATLKDSLHIKLAAKRQSRKGIPVSASTQRTTEPEVTTTLNPPQVVSVAKFPAAPTFRAINAKPSTASQSEVSVASGVSASGLELLCAAADLATADQSQAGPIVDVAHGDPFVSRPLPVATRIMLKFNKGKAPAEAGPATEDSQPHTLKKRKRVNASTREDDAEEEGVVAIERVKRVKPITGTQVEKDFPVDAPEDVQMSGTLSDMTPQLSGAVEGHQIDIKNGSSTLATLRFEGTKVVIDFAPSS